MTVRLLVTRRVLGPLTWYAVKFPDGKTAARFIVFAVFIPLVGVVCASVQFEREFGAQVAIIR